MWCSKISSFLPQNLCFCFVSDLGSSLWHQDYRNILGWRMVVLKVLSGECSCLNALGQRTVLLYLRKWSFSTTGAVSGGMPMGVWGRGLHLDTQSTCVVLDNQWRPSCSKQDILMYELGDLKARQLRHTGLAFPFLHLRILMCKYGEDGQ